MSETRKPMTLTIKIEDPTYALARLVREEVAHVLPDAVFVGDEWTSPAFRAADEVLSNDSLTKASDDGPTRLVTDEELRHALLTQVDHLLTEVIDKLAAEQRAIVG